MRVGWVGMVVLLAAALGGCAGAAAKRQDGTAARATTSSPASAANDELQPPGGTWLTDAQGQQYYAQRLEMPPGSYVWTDEEKTRARIRNGVEVDVVAHDEHGITMKVYRTDDDVAPPPRPSPSRAELAGVAATYVSDAEAGDGRRLIALDQGLPQRGQWRNGFDLADADGDGKLDIVFAPPRKSRRPPVVFRGDGAGGWSFWQEARFPALPFDYGDAATGDLNGDGITDVVLASHLSGVVATVGDGKGGYTAWSEGIEFLPPGGSTPGAAFTSRAIGVADWNRDGRPDVIVLGEGPQLSIAGARSQVQQGSRGLVIYLNDGDGTWTKRAERGSGSFGNTLAIADVNGDGLLDAVTGSERRGFRGIVSQGQPDGSWREVEVTALRPGSIPRAVAVADVDGDGRQDLVVGYMSVELGVDRRGVDVLLARGDGWQRVTLVADAVDDDTAVGEIAINAVATGDVDADGHVDVVAVDDRGELMLFRGDGRGAFVEEPLQTPPHEACAGYGLRLSNVDGAPGDEIVVSHADEDDTDVMTGVQQCPTQGSLRVWRVVRD